MIPPSTSTRSLSFMAPPRGAAGRLSGTILLARVDARHLRSIMRLMKPREERIRIGALDVHTWVGGQGDPLLVLHGAGGNRGWTRWIERVAERFTVWAPTHPGFGRSGDADWMEGIDDLARFHLWFIDAAGLGRPHLVGHSIGGWTAAEMA